MKIQIKELKQTSEGVVLFVNVEDREMCMPLRENKCDNYGIVQAANLLAQQYERENHKLPEVDLTSLNEKFAGKKIKRTKDLTTLERDFDVKKHFK
ncbi:hypothetical protein CMI37_29295 [Candidatus Pacearchaeota archaeon]|jgi:hypothetical protein|nr:hypothetical protein [Candidatus Pacearchaeota archaeon]|tara:strand:+ start:294 stop:581 length:288 start_codon:yes stop_codon:yes gene_type:complete